MEEKTDILSLSLEELEAKMLQIGKEKYRAKQIFRWLHLQRADSFQQMTDISAQTREALEKKFCIKSLKIQKRLVSSVDNTVIFICVARRK